MRIIKIILKKIKQKKNKSKLSIDNFEINKKEKKDACYEELLTNENYALYISEVIDNKKEN